MKCTKQKNLSPTKFEDFVDEATGDFSADIIADGKFIECKSWGSKAPGMSNFPNQMINYFNTQNSLSKFQFQFDPDRWVPSPSDLNQALKANTNLFDTNKWSNYQQMFQFTNAQVAPNDINGLIDFITANKFSDIINP